MSSIDINAQNSHLRVLLGQVVQPVFRDSTGALSDSQVDKARSLDELRNFLINQAQIDSLSFRSPYANVLSQTKYQPLYQFLYHDQIDPSVNYESLIYQLEADLIGVDADAFVAHHIRSQEGREYLAAILDPQFVRSYALGHNINSWRANYAKAFARAGMGLVDQKEIEEVTHALNLWNLGNWGVTNEEVSEATLQARDILNQAETKYINQDERYKQYQAKGTEVLASWGVEDFRHQPGVLGKMQDHLLMVYCMADDDLVWPANNNEVDRVRSFLKGEIRYLLKNELPKVGSDEAKLKVLNLKVQKILHKNLSGSTTFGVNHVDTSARTYIRLVLNKANREPFDQLVQFSDELKYAFEMGERVITNANLMSPPSPGGRELEGGGNSLAHLITELERVKRSLWYGYKQHRALSRGLSQTAHIFGFDNDIDDIQKANEQIDRWIERLEAAPTPEVLVTTLQEIEKELFQLAQNGNTLDRAFKAAEMEGTEQLLGLVQTIGMIYATRGALRATGAAKILATVTGQTQAMGLSGQIVYGGIRGFLAGGAIAAGENIVAITTHEVREGEEDWESLIYDSAATGVAMSFMGVFPALGRVNQSMLGQMGTRWLSYGGRYLKWMPKWFKLPIGLISDGLAETFEESSDQIIRKALGQLSYFGLSSFDFQSLALSKRDFYELASLSMTGGAFKANLIMESIGYRPPHSQSWSPTEGNRAARGGGGTPPLGSRGGRGALDTRTSRPTNGDSRSTIHELRTANCDPRIVSEQEILEDLNRERVYEAMERARNDGVEYEIPTHGSLTLEPEAGETTLHVDDLGEGASQVDYRTQPGFWSRETGGHVHLVIDSTARAQALGSVPSSQDLTGAFARARTQPSQEITHLIPVVYRSSIYQRGTPTNPVMLRFGVRFVSTANGMGYFEITRVAVTGAAAAFIPQIKEKLLREAREAIENLNNGITTDEALELAAARIAEPATGVDRFLMAGNGLAAMRFMDAVQELKAAGESIEVVALATQEDLESQASFLDHADFVVPQPNPTMGGMFPYEDVDLLMNVARRYRANAVYPGWGWAAEEDYLPAAALRDGINFMGPPQKAMRALGDKVRAMLIYQTLCGNQTMASWSGTGIQVEDIHHIPDSVIQHASVNTVDKAIQAATRMGYPIMLKAAGVGGGRGMKRCYCEADVRQFWDEVVRASRGSDIFVMELAAQTRKVETLDQAREVTQDLGYPLTLRINGEAYRIDTAEELMSFDGLFRQIADQRALEPGKTSPIQLVGGGTRHIEVQIVADKHGNVVAKWPRDCSIQRNDQKVIEETAVLEDGVAKKLMQNAVKLAKGVGYQGMGTVEFLVDPYTDKPYFLEMNTRLQVEHPVTEGTTDVDLLKTLVQISRGKRLHEIDQIRAYFGIPTDHTGDFDFESVMYDRKPEGHVIALRITWDDPETLKPTSGPIRVQRFGDKRGVWAYFGLPEGGKVGPSSDPQGGHVFIRGRDRTDAIRIAQEVVDGRIEIFGGSIKTIVPVLDQILKHPDYQAGRFDNASLEQWRKRGEIKVEKPEPTLAAVCSALINVARQAQEQRKEFQSLYDRGHYANAEELLKLQSEVTAIIDGIRYEFTTTQVGPDRFVLQSKHNKESRIEGTVKFRGAYTAFVTINGKQHKVFFENDEKTFTQKLQFGTKACTLLLAEKDPSKLTTVMGGKVIKLVDGIAEGKEVKAGDPLVIIEAMKMEQTITAPEDGRITRIQAGPKMDIAPGDLLFEFELDRTPELSTPYFQSFGELEVQPVAKLSDRGEVDAEVIDSIFSGFAPTEIPQALEALFLRHFRHVGTTQYWGQMFFDFVSRYRKGMPSKLYDELMSYARTLREKTDQERIDISTHAQLLREKVNKKKYQDEFGAKREVYAKFDFLVNFEDFLNLSLRTSPQEMLASQLLRAYADSEQYFGLRSLPSTTRPDFKRAQAHQTVHLKNFLLRRLLEELTNLGIRPASLSMELGRIRRFVGSDYGELAAQCKEVLLSTADPRTPAQRYQDMAKCFEDIAKLSTVEARRTAVESLVGQTDAMFGELVPLSYSHPDDHVKRLAIFAYTRRAYRIYPLNLTRIENFDDHRTTVSFAYRYPQEAETTRFGQVVSLPSLSQLGQSLGGIISDYRKRREEAARGAFPQLASGKCSLTLLVDGQKSQDTREAQSQELASQLRTHLYAIGHAGIKRVTIAVTRQPHAYPSYYTFKVSREADGRVVITEDVAYRDVEPPLAYQIELELLRNFNLRPLTTVNKNIHLYEAEEKGAGVDDTNADRRFFVRSLVRDISNGGAAIPSIDNMMEQCMNELEVALTRDTGRNKKDWNDIYLNITPFFEEMDKQQVREYLERLVSSNKDRLNSLKVSRLEFRFRVHPEETHQVTTYRLIIDNQPRTKLQSNLFREEPIFARGETTTMPLDNYTPAVSLVNVTGDISTKVLMPYAILDPIEKRSRKARAMGTTYAYEWPPLFEDAVDKMWGNKDGKPTGSLVTRTELYLGPDGQLCEDTFNRRPVGSNINETDPSQTNGAVAFRLNLKTPEYPQGREIIIAVMNDVNVQNGSFGPKESALYQAVTRRARQEGIPFVAIQANTGARFGMEAEVVKRFRTSFSFKDASVGFRDPSNVMIDYFYLTEEDYQVVKDSVICERIEVEEGEVRYKITGIPGKTEGLDADSLRGSGGIAGASDASYDEIFTASITSGYMAVGIGAYLARLLHRSIQDGPKLLTGAKTYNELLKARRYLNNEQLAGKQVLVPNGVSHWGVSGDAEAVDLLVRTIGFIPKDNRSLPPVSLTTDPVERRLQPPSSDNKDEYYLAREFFDRDGFDPQTDTFMEEYGRVITVGRAKLGGRGVGFVNARPTPVVIKTIPADPGEPESQARTEKQFSKVLPPDASYKLAEALENFNREGLPAFIFADFRGFSAGTRDMYLEVLKFGSMIVSALRKFNQPVYVYFPPGSQLRGGAWVVFDKDISGQMRIRMAAAKDGVRGGVLEPEGAVKILGQSAIPAHIVRLRGELGNLKDLWDRLVEAATQTGNRILVAEVNQLRDIKPNVKRPEVARTLRSLSVDADKSTVLAIASEIDQLEKNLAIIGKPIFERIVDFQHTPEAMLAREVIDEIIPWGEARQRYHELLETDLEVLTLEREIREFYPTIRPRELRTILGEYATAVESHYRITYERRGTPEWRPQAKREELMRRVRTLKAARYAAEAFEADPVASLTGARSAFFRGVALAGVSAERGIVSTFDSLIALVAGVVHLFTSSSQTRAERFVDLSRILREVALWRHDDSDEDNPRFFDDSGHCYLASNDQQGELRLKVVEGELKWSDDLGGEWRREHSIREEWKGVLERAEVKQCLRQAGYNNVVLLRPRKDGDGEEKDVVITQFAIGEAR